MPRLHLILLIAIVLGSAAAARAEEHPSNIADAADRAVSEGRHEDAIRLYNRAIDLTPPPAFNALDDRFSYAYRIVLCALSKGDYELTGVTLKKLPGFYRDMSDDWKERIALIERFIANPAKVDVRIEFADNFWFAGHFDQDFQREGMKLLEATLASPEPNRPTSEQRIEILKSLLNRHLDHGDLASAEKRLQSLLEAAPATSEAASGTFAYASALKQRQQLDAAMKLFATVPEGPYPARNVLQAHLYLSDIALAQKDDERRVRHLKLVAESDKTFPAERNVIDTSNARQAALEALGHHYKTKGDAETALAYFQRWTPRSWCGTCRASREYSRHVAIAECLVMLGRIDEAWDDHVMPASKPGPWTEIDERVAIVAIAIQKKRLRLPQFVQEMREADTQFAKLIVKLGEAELTQPSDPPKD